MDNPNQKRTQFLPFHPFKPSLPQKLKPNKPANDSKRLLREFHPYAPPTPNNANVPPPPIATNIKGIMFHPYKSQTAIPEFSCNELEWKVKWMEQFDECKTKCNEMVEQKTDKIDRLKQYMKDQTQEHYDVVQKWKERCGRRDDIIKKLKQKITAMKRHSKDEETQTEINQMTAETQTDEPVTKHDNESQTTPVDINQLGEAGECLAQGNVSEVIVGHSEAIEIVRAIKIETGRTNYQCKKCLKFFNKKSSLNDHLNETACAGEKILEWRCEACLKMFTYRGLRVHLAQFVSSNPKHKPRGKHAELTLEQHQKMLDDHKSSKIKTD